MKKEETEGLRNGNEAKDVKELKEVKETEEKSTHAKWLTRLMFSHAEDAEKKSSGRDKRICRNE